MSHPILPGLIGAGPKRRRPGGGRTLGWVLGIVAALVTVLVLIGFGVDQQAHHHVIPDAHTSQQG